MSTKKKAFYLFQSIKHLKSFVFPVFLLKNAVRYNCSYINQKTKKETSKIINSLKQDEQYQSIFLFAETEQNSQLCSRKLSFSISRIKKREIFVPEILVS